MNGNCGNTAYEITALLTEMGIRAETETRATHVEISTTGSQTEPHHAHEPATTFIIPTRWGKTMEEARTISETIAARLRTLRRERKVMVVSADLWKEQREMMTARLVAHCGIFTRIFARNCELRRITRPEADAFLSKWHSYGTATCRHCYGLFTKSVTNGTIPSGTLVAAAEFSNARKMVKDGKEIRSYEWVRYASLPNMRIDGGMGKMLRGFIDDVKPDDIMSYADLEWSNGDAYKKLGFIEDGMRDPVLFAIDPHTMRRIPLSGSRKSAAQNSTCGSQRKALPPVPNEAPQNGNLYYRNFGSVKYRLNPVK